VLFKIDILFTNRKIIEKFGMNAYSMHDVDLHGIKDILEKALNDVDPS